MNQRVLIVNKFYYRRGGDCVVALNQETLLRERGHDVAVFAMQYPENLPSQWQSYWPSEVTFSGGAAEKARALQRTLGIGEVRRRFARILREFRPDVVHLHNIHSYLSPVVAEMAHKRGIRVVWTLHDYKLLCPSYSCLRDGKICELCFNDKSQVLRQRCMKGSLAASTLAYLEALKWNTAALSKYTDRFVCPSGFMAEKMSQGGFPKEKLVTLCNFLAPEMADEYGRLAASGHTHEREPYYCYVGRLSAEKGVETLLAAAAELPYELRVAGDGPLAEELRKRYGHCSHIKFLGHLDVGGVRALLSGGRMSVLPSECYENNPLGVIESLCAGTPVVGARIGGIPELIDADSGTVFESGDKEALKDAIIQQWNRKPDYASIARKSLTRFSADVHYGRLMEIYNEISRS